MKKKMTKILTKKVYKVTIECKQKNKWAEEDGMTFGLKSMDEMFNMFMGVLGNQKKNPWSTDPSKSRKITLELIEEK